MPMDARKHLIIIKGKDQTDSVANFQFRNGKCEVVYTSAPNKTYSFQSSNVEILPLQKKIDPARVIVTVNGQTISGIDEILDFGGYRSSLALAKKYGCETVAFPLISSGVFGYPKDQALRVAVDAISEFLAENDMTVYLVIFSRAAYAIGNKLFADIAAYIDDHYVDAHTDLRRERTRRMSVLESRTLSADAAAAPMAVGGLDSLLAHLDAGFSETLLKLIDRSGKKDSEIYKKANVDRKLFSKIRNNPDYKPSKATAIAFAIALELNLDETRDLVARAGYALSASSKFDVIIEYFIRQKKYDIFEINEALFAFDQSLLGA